MYNFVYNPNYWDKVAKKNSFSKVCSGYNKEEDFWAHQPNVQGWNLKKDMIFLDFGCGPGRIIKTISPLVKEYYGVDISKNWIEKAKFHHKAYSNIQFFVNDGCALGCFDDCRFDFVLEHLVFIHLQKDLIVNYIREIYRTLKPGGTFLSKSLPKNNGYVNGFSFEEVGKVFSIFEEVSIREDSPGIRYCIQCIK